MESLAQYIYTSSARFPMAQQDLDAILRVARARNTELGVTGMLLYDGGSFFQVIEGDETVVRKLFDRISHDIRHERIISIVEEPVAKRSFGDWTMGYCRSTPGELAGLVHVFEEGGTLSTLSPGRARKLVEVFCKGGWRSRLLGDAERVISRVHASVGQA